MAISQGPFRFQNVLRVEDLRYHTKDLPEDAKVFYVDEHGLEHAVGELFIDGNGEVLLS